MTYLKRYAPFLSLPVLSVCAGCGSQAGPDYQGTSLLTLKGSVVLEKEGLGSDLVPALGFVGKGALRIVDVAVNGAFPASFTLDIFAPPPDDAMMPVPVGKFALGYVTALPRAHATTLPLPVSASAGSDGCDENACYSSASWCSSADESHCYVEHSVCTPCAVTSDAGSMTSDCSSQQCRVESTSGDASIRDFWKNLAGLSENFVLAYLDPVAAGDRRFQILLDHGRTLPPGYLLFAVTKTTDAERTRQDACNDVAEKDALAAYGSGHGVSTDDIDAWPKEKADAAWDEIKTKKLELMAARGCDAFFRTYRLDRVDNPARRPITVHIGPDAVPLATF
jgi:hypothetical protein